MGGSIFSKIYVFTRGRDDDVYKKMLNWGLTHSADVVLFPDPAIVGYEEHKEFFGIRGSDLPAIIMVNKDFKLKDHTKGTEVKTLMFTMNTPLLKEVLGDGYDKLWGVLQDFQDICEEQGFDAAYEEVRDIFARAWGTKILGKILGIVCKKVGL